MQWILKNSNNWDIKMLFKILVRNKKTYFHKLSLITIRFICNLKEKNPQPPKKALRPFQISVVLEVLVY